MRTDAGPSRAYGAPFSPPGSDRLAAALDDRAAAAALPAVELAAVSCVDARGGEGRGSNGGGGTPSRNRRAPPPMGDVPDAGAISGASSAASSGRSLASGNLSGRSSSSAASGASSASEDSGVEQQGLLSRTGEYRAARRSPTKAKAYAKRAASAGRSRAEVDRERVHGGGRRDGSGRRDGGSYAGRGDSDGEGRDLPALMHEKSELRKRLKRCAAARAHTHAARIPSHARRRTRADGRAQAHAPPRVLAHARKRMLFATGGRPTLRRRTCARRRIRNAAGRVSIRSCRARSAVSLSNCCSSQ